MANTALNRSVVQLLTNKSGGAVAQGDVVVVDTTTASSFTTTTTSGYVNGPVGVVVEPNGIANDAIGLVSFGGYVSKINLSGSASLGDLVKTHSVAKQGVRHAAPAVAGDFAIVMATGTSPAAILFGIEFGIGSGASGDSSYTAAYASRPAASNDGDLFLPSDGFQVERDTGAAWVPWGPLFPFTAPVSGDFAWINQGGASISTTNGGIYLLGPAGAGVNWRIRKKAAPSVPYTITAAILPHIQGADLQHCGLCFRQSSDGKLVVFTIHYESVAIGWKLAVYKYTNPTTFSAAYTTVGCIPMLLFLRIADNNTNRICSWSTNGQDFHDIHTVGRTDFLTADEVGFLVNAQNATYPAGMTLLSWKEA